MSIDDLLIAIIIAGIALSNRVLESRTRFAPRTQSKGAQEGDRSA